MSYEQQPLTLASLVNDGSWVASQDWCNDLRQVFRKRIYFMQLISKLESFIFRQGFPKGEWDNRFTENKDNLIKILLKALCFVQNY